MENVIMKSKFLPSFVMTCMLIGSFLTPSSASALMVTPQKVTFLNNQGLTLEGWLFRPVGTTVHPAIVMLHGCMGVYSFGDPAQGVNSLYREWGNRLVKAGYAALLVDSFTPRNIPQEQCDRNGAGLSVVNIRASDAYAGLNYLASQAFVDPDKIGLLGWSHGGSGSMAAMDITKFRTLHNFKAAVAFYPGCGLNNLFGGLTDSTWKPYTSLIIFFGTADKVVSLADCKNRVRTAKALGATDLGIIVFPNAQHSFDVARKVDDHFTQYDVNAKTMADATAMLFFDKRLH
jgi:dienelactone hydrolase